MVYEYLLIGEQNAQTQKALCALLNISDRDLTATIEKERREGKPICASCGRNPGYFIAPDKEAMQHYCTSLQHRESEIAKTRLACEKTIPTLPDRSS